MNNLKNFDDFVNEEIKLGKIGKLALAGGIAATMGLSSCNGPIAKEIPNNIEVVNQQFTKEGIVVFARSFMYGKLSYITVLIKTNDGKKYKVFLSRWDTYKAKEFWDLSRSGSTKMKKGDPVILNINGDDGFIVWNGKKLNLTKYATKEHFNRQERIEKNK
jgi:hypothetical protein